MSQRTPRAPIDRNAPAVPVEFARLILQMMAERGIPQEQALAGLDIPASLLATDGASLSINQHESLLRRGIALSGNEGGLGYEIGLRIGLTTHALLAYALLSQVTLGDAIRFGIEFSQDFVPIYRGALRVEDDFAVLDITMDEPVEPALQRYAFDMALVSVWSGMHIIMGASWTDVELWFDYPEPEYFAAYEQRLPACRFGMGANQLCFPATQLTRRLQTGDPVMAQLMTERLERERQARKRQGSTDIRVLVRELLVADADGYPALEAVASRLFMSTRTLKRKLQQADTTFQTELDGVRLNHARRLLGMSELGIEEIAGRMGFAEPASFTHAFRRWTGMTPSEWRSRHKGGDAPA
ncbi:MAG: AraC family transcriptional regulator [Moraxellaceae bacterium]|jgi:AraC-like DNA-binding protein|nr:AraC family transcriptional regulator [Moraxellaceae bacterium]